MTRAELIKVLAELEGTSRQHAEKSLYAFVSVMRERLLADGHFSLCGVGKLKLVKRAERKARNPKTGESMRIPARHAIKFIPSKSMREALRQKAV